MNINKELIDQLLVNYKTHDDHIGENDLLKHLTKRLIERDLVADMNDRLGHTNNASFTNAGVIRCLPETV